jgi:glycolate oxidase FAD binding subunit
VQRFVTVAVSDAAQAHRLAHAVVHAQVVPSAVEVDLGDDGAGTLTVLLGGREQGVEQRAETTARLLGSEASVSTQAPASWSAYPWGTEEVGLKLTCALSGLEDVIAAASGMGALVRGSAGTGVLYAALPVEDPATYAASLDLLRRTCTTHGGSAVVVDAPREVKESLDVWGPVPALDLMRRVKDQFDPDHRLAPGRFVGGI